MEEVDGDGGVGGLEGADGVQEAGSSCGVRNGWWRGGERVCIVPDVQTFSILVNGFCKEGLLLRAESMVDFMIRIGVELNVVT